MALAHYPECSLKPPVRCYQQIGSGPQLFCGAPAAWRRAGNTLFDDGYFCDAHRGESDEALPDTLIVHRVRLTVAVYFAGVSALATAARAEAVEWLEAAVEGAGGVIIVEGVSSGPVRYGPLPPVGEGRTVKGVPR